jgi:AcrR family transcriptional regulator
MFAFLPRQQSIFPKCSIRNKFKKLYQNGAAMPPEKTDRRVNRTQKLLHDALHQLMGQKRYDDITVQDIIDRADVGRSTFYAHFQDKEELAVSELTQIMENLNEAMEQSEQDSQRLLPALAIFKHVQGHKEIISSMLCDHGTAFFFDRGKEFWARRLEERLQTLLPPRREPAVPLPLIAECIAGMYLSLLKWWLENKMPYSAEQIAQMTEQMLLPGIWNALGVEPAEQYKES